MYHLHIQGKKSVKKEISVQQNSLRQGDASLPLLFNFTLEYAFTEVQETQVGLKLNWTHQFLLMM
jgi:hypothetical protein